MQTFIKISIIYRWPLLLKEIQKVATRNVKNEPIVEENDILNILFDKYFYIIDFYFLYLYKIIILAEFN